MTILTLDVGSSSVRALLLDDDLNVIHTARRQTTFDYSGAGAAVVDAMWLRGQVEACIDEIMQHPAAADVRTVGMATFVGNVLGVDANNQPQTPLYTYADARSAADVAALREEIDVAAAHQRTGCPHHTAYLPGRLRWLYRTQPEKVQNVVKWLDFATYCYRAWFGGDVPCSYSMASWNGLLNQQLLVWDETWLSVLPINHEHLPPLADFDKVQQVLMGGYVERWALLRDVPFYLGVGDGAAANIGSGGVDANAMVLTMGTTAAVRIVVERGQRVPDGLWLYCVDRERCLLGGATSEGGNIFEWAMATFRVDAAQIESALLARPADAHGLTVLPLLAGERSPGYVADAVGTFHGVRLSTPPLDMVQAALEAVALRLAMIADLLPDVETVYAGGGAMLKSWAWAQMIANALNKPVHRVDVTETAARGVGALITGRETLTAQPPTLDVLEPEAGAVEALRGARERQKRLYDRFYGM